MPFTLVLHISDEDPIVGEVDEMPTPGDQTITVMNPRRLDGKDLHYLQHGVVKVIWSMYRMNFIEILPSEEDEEIIGFVRE